MKKRIFLFLVFILAILSSKAQVSDGYLWVAVSDSSALPVSSDRSANAELNAIFDKFRVTNYFYRFEYFLWDNDDSITNLQVYEIQYDSVFDTTKPEYISSEYNFYMELYQTGLFSYIFNFLYNRNGHLLAYFIDSSALPISDTRSGNNDINTILEEFNISSYYQQLPPHIYQNTISIACSCNIIDLYIRLSELDTIFTKFFIESFSYPPVSIQEFHLPNIKTYPNPFLYSISIDYEDIRNVEIYNAEGVLVYSQNSGSFKQIDLSFLAMGMYILKIKTIDNKVMYNKIIKGSKL